MVQATRPRGDVEAATMRGVVYHGRKDVRVEDVPAPRLEAPTDALVRVTTAAICGSDLHLYHHVVPGMGPQPVLGHELVGVIEALGPGVTGLAVGQRVVVSGLLACGSCFYCARGLFSQCETTNPNKLQRKLHGQSHGALLGYGKPAGGYGGGQAERVRVPHAQTNLLPVPEDVPDEKAVFLSDVLNVAWMGNERAETGPGTSVAVWGCGPVGLLALHCAHARGARRLFAIDHHADRLRVARERFGAHPIDFDREDVVEAIHAETDGHGADVGVDCTGFRFARSARHKVQRLTGLETDSADTLAEMARALRGGGVLSVVGFYLGFANQFPIGAIMEKDLSVHGCAVNVQAYWRALLARVRAGELDPSFVATHVLELEEAPRAYEMMDERAEGVLKVLLRPGAARHPGG